MFTRHLQYAVGENSEIIWKSTIFLRFWKPRVIQIGNHANSKTLSTFCSELWIKTGILVGLEIWHPHEVFLRESALYEYGSLWVISGDPIHSVPFQHLCWRWEICTKTGCYVPMNGLFTENKWRRWVWILGISLLPNRNFGSDIVFNLISILVSNWDRLFLTANTRLHPLGLPRTILLVKLSSLCSSSLWWLFRDSNPSEFRHN